MRPIPGFSVAGDPEPGHRRRSVPRGGALGADEGDSPFSHQPRRSLRLRTAVRPQPLGAIARGRASSGAGRHRPSPAQGG
jgi:hypothetical protein